MGAIIIPRLTTMLGDFFRAFIHPSQPRYLPDVPPSSGLGVVYSLPLHALSEPRLTRARRQQQWQPIDLGHGC